MFEGIIMGSEWANRILAGYANLFPESARKC